MKKLILTLLLTLGAMTAAMADNAPNLEAQRPEPVTVQVRQAAIDFTVSPDAEAPVRFEVFSITGQLVTTASLDKGDNRSVELRKGCYIVRTTAPGSKPQSRRLTVQ